MIIDGSQWVINSIENGRIEQTQLYNCIKTGLTTYVITIEEVKSLTRIKSRKTSENLEGLKISKHSERIRIPIPLKIPLG